MKRQSQNLPNKLYKKAFTLVEFAIVITIISLLIAVVSNSRILINKAKSQKAQIETKTAPILNITNDKGNISAKLWLEASDPNSYTILSDNVVEIWHDKSPYGNDVTNGTNTTYLPTIATNAINDRGGALYFDGNDRLFSDGMVPLAFGDDQYSIVAVWQADLLSVQVIWEQNSSQSGSGVVLYARGSLITNAIGSYGFAGQFSDNATISPYEANVPYTSILVKDDLAIDLYHLGALTSDTIPLDTSLYTERHSVGSVASKGGEYFTGYIAEIIVFDKILTSSELELIHSYLFAKYGLKRDL
ncbi:MAG: prepilin-type N-terminal cleavage/methylation domain-containing protein [Rickettsiales bacterium]|jgi:prepilin-type N-terminal cleavage/methylation domain-containing protein|nr:prepilin-type N-terminal cleavage/methylation domain-containing protein [Rickettsiales bacterium]